MELTFVDVARLSAHLGLAAAQFLREHAGYRDGRLYLNFPCAFQRGNRCGVYPVRPLQCLVYPFWGDLLEEDPLASPRYAQTGDWCEPIRSFRPLRLLSSGAVKRLKQFDDALYGGTDHLELLVATGHLSEADVRALGYDWTRPAPSEPG
ncbi:MAG: hypothetical protein Kow0069_11520 [Promethearchaeota archaeon]